MSNRLIIVGAGGHGKVIADIALKNGYTDISFVDDHTTSECMGFSIIGVTDDIESFDDGQTDFMIGIGDNEIRKRIAEKYDVIWATLIHPSAQIATNVTIGTGTVIMAGAIVNVCTTIGEHCIINTGAIVEHDNVVGDYVHISPNVALGGTVSIGEQSHVGIGVSVNNNITICNSCVIGAGAVVVKDITESAVYVGVPAAKLKGK